MDFLTLLSNSAVVSLVGSSATSIAINYLGHHYGKKLQFEKNKNEHIFHNLKPLSENISMVEIAKCKNILEIAEISDDLKMTTLENNIEFSIEWFNRFFESASMVSDESMQTIWAKVLNGEVQRKGKYSFRFIEAMRLLSQDEAEIFLRASRLTVKDISSEVYIYAPDTEDQSKLYESFDVKDDDFLLLEECGLINMGVPTNHTFELSKEVFNGFYNEHVFVRFYEKNSSQVKTFGFNSYSLTRFGRQLYELIEEHTNEAFILGLAKTIQTQFEEDFCMSAYVMLSIDDNDEGIIDLDLQVDLLASK